MSKNLPPSASVATTLEGAKMYAPSADRNASFLCDLIAAQVPGSGTALEIASGTGQHVVQYAQTLPDLTWQPTDIEPARLASIDAYAAEAGLTNLRPARFLDATQAGWHENETPVDLIIVVNLLHLIGTAPARTLVTEALAALRPEGRFIIYGPFKRNGHLTTEGDTRFDADLRAADPEIGYKNDQDIVRWLKEAGAATVQHIDMPANNLALVATKG